MNALLVNVTIDAGHADDAQTELETNVVPRVKEAPGVLSAYWMRSADGTFQRSMRGGRLVATPSRMVRGAWGTFTPTLVSSLDAARGSGSS